MIASIIFRRLKIKSLKNVPLARSVPGDISLLSPPAHRAQ